ncbi:hypothetical protein KC318_g16635, partial [Hortaea werneckii]
KDRPHTSRRRSDYPAPAGDYFDRRNGEHPPYADGVAASPQADGAPKAAKGDKIASWVDSVNEDPPPPPPVEGTIIDAPVHFADDIAPDPMEDTTAREMRHRRHRDKDGYSEVDPERIRRKRGPVKSTSDGSSHGKHRSYGGPVNSMGFDDMGAKTFDGRPAMPNGGSKRGSWFKKITGL